MATETVDQPDEPTAAQSWPHQGLLVSGRPAVVFNSDATAEELIAWAHGQIQMTVRLLAALLPEPDHDTTEGRALGAIHAMLEPVEAALELAVEKVPETAEVTHG